MKTKIDYERVAELLGRRFGDDPVALAAVHKAIERSYKTRLKDVEDRLVSEHKDSLKKLHESLESSFARSLVQTTEKLTSNFHTEIQKEAARLTEEAIGSVETVDKRAIKALDTLKSLQERFETWKDRIERSLENQRDRVEGISVAIGGPNRSIYVAGALPSAYYSDLNIIPGTGITLTPGTDRVNGWATLTISATSTGFTLLTPTSGIVNSSNTTFVFAVAPSLILADGIILKPLDSNGNLQWSITGTTVTMVNPPSFTLLGIQ